MGDTMASSGTDLKANSRRKLALRLVLVSVVGTFGMTGWVGCGEESLPPIGDGKKVVVDKSNDDGGRVGCVEGTVRECTVYLEVHNGVQSCYEGSQECVDGSWSECVGT